MATTTEAGSVAPIFNVEMERGTLGGVLLAGIPAVQRLVVDAGLRPEHFYWRQHERVFAAMVRLHDEAAAIDVNTVVDRLRIDGHLDEVGGPGMVDALAAFAPAAGDWLTYGERVVRDARRRARRAALNEAQAALEAGDDEAYALAEARLVAADGRDETTWDAEATRDRLFEWLSGSDDNAIPTPFVTINRLLFGGVRRGDTSLVGGWSSHGKSSLVDGCLEHAAAHGHTAHLYLNEMSLVSRGLRTLASMSGVPFGTLLTRELSQRDHERVLRALDRGMPFGMSSVAGWEAADICRHIIARGWDTAALDSINLVDHDGTKGIDRVSSLLCTAAQRANTALWVVAQLNKARADSGVLPLPVERDVRESGKLVYDAANLLLVHRDQEEIATPLGHGSVATGEVRRLSSGVIVLAKARNGELGKARSTLNPRTLRWMPEVDIPELGEAVAA